MRPLILSILKFVFLKSIFFYKKKWSFLQKDFSKMLCLLLLGFLIGNTFGTFLSFIRAFVIWDGIILLSLIAIIECISYLTYRQTKNCLLKYTSADSRQPLFCEAQECSKKTALTVCLTRQGAATPPANVRGSQPNKAGKSPSRYCVPTKQLTHLYVQHISVQNMFQFTNLFKIGLLIGFFVDAFKVGS